MLPNAGRHIDLVATATSYLVSRSYSFPSPAMYLRFDTALHAVRAAASRVD